MACKRHDQEFGESLVTPDLKDCVAVGGARVTAQAIDRARKVGVAAIVTGGIDDADLEAVLGYNLGVAITGSERIGLTVIITEGFGEIAMARRTFDLLASRKGDDAAVNGATQIRAGVMRPEVVIPLRGSAPGIEARAEAAGRLAIGAPIRVIRDPYFGLIGRVTALPQEPQTLQSGSKARVLEVTFESGEGVIIPRANVELIEGTAEQES
jgi:hypothetical protein